MNDALTCMDEYTSIEETEAVMKDNILGTLYGMAVGDALGMPSELWSRRKVKAYFGVITDFLDGPDENEVARHFKKGQFTDDTSQALVILDALVENDFTPDTRIIARRLIDWADQHDAFHNEVLGPSSKASLEAIKEGKDAQLYTRKAETNGAAMRIAPVGCLFSRKQKEALVQYVYEVSRVTHETDVAISGAAMIAAAVTAALEDCDWDTIMQDALDVFDIAAGYGAETYSASLSARLKLALDLARQYRDDAEAFSQAIYDVIGCGVLTSESVPAALAMAYYAREPHRCGLMCANLGGDTDTIGAMATAICGAKAGIRGIDSEWIDVIDQCNDINFFAYADVILSKREQVQ